MVLWRLILAASLLLSICACKADEKEDDESDVDRASLTNCKLPVAHDRTNVSIGFPRYPDRLKAIGPVVATVIMVDFPDSPATMSPENAFALIAGASETFSEMS
jgi:hypothetical protein